MTRRVLAFLRGEQQQPGQRADARDGDGRPALDPCPDLLTGTEGAALGLVELHVKAVERLGGVLDRP